MTSTGGSLSCISNRSFPLVSAISWPVISGLSSLAASVDGTSLDRFRRRQRKNHPSATATNAPPPSPVPRPIASEGVDDGCGAADGLSETDGVGAGVLVAVELKDAVGNDTVVIVFTVKAKPEYMAVVYTSGSGALKTSSLILQHVVFVRLTRSSAGAGSPVLQHHFSFSGHLKMRWLLPAGRALSLAPN
jgi:hypothetical protein